MSLEDLSETLNELWSNGGILLENQNYEENIEPFKSESQSKAKRFNSV